MHTECQIWETLLEQDFCSLGLSKALKCLATEWNVNWLPGRMALCMLAFTTSSCKVFHRSGGKPQGNFQGMENLTVRTILPYWHASTDERKREHRPPLDSPAAHSTKQSQPTQTNSAYPLEGFYNSARLQDLLWNFLPITQINGSVTFRLNRPDQKGEEEK